MNTGSKPASNEVKEKVISEYIKTAAGRQKCLGDELGQAAEGQEFSKHHRTDDNHENTGCSTERERNRFFDDFPSERFFQ